MDSHSKRPLLILDVDETLIHASTAALEFPSDFVVSDYAVIKRPKLETFLADRSKHYDISIWSAGTEDYVNQIVQEIVPPSVRPVFVWCRDRCTQRRDLETDEYFYQKDLKKVKKFGYPLSRVLIVEDARKNVQLHYGNAVYVQPFYGNPMDCELEELGPFLDHLSTRDDFRKIEKRNWRAFKPT